MMMRVAMLSQHSVTIKHGAEMQLTTRTHEDCSTSRIHFGVVVQLPETSAITTRPPHRSIFENGNKA